MNHWQPYTPSAAEPWDLKKVGHLYRRAGFGATHAAMQKALADGPAKTIDALLAGGTVDDEFETTSAFMVSERSLPAGAPTRQLAAWWLYRMMHSPHPLREKLALFWHNHFATSNVKVANARYMLGQYRTIHTHALASFADLLQAMTVDPAMMVWLDTVESKKGMPNENYARELMELFSLGIGHYTEADIREAAKAFTGYGIQKGKCVFTARNHDGSLKRVFGTRSAYKAEGIVGLCLKQEACAKFIVGKLCTFFISDTTPPDAAAIDALAAEYRRSGYDTATIVSTILRSERFFKSYRQKVKSPVEFAVGIVRALEGNVGPLPLAEALEGLGQVLFEPPSVKGWDGGTAWLNAQSLLFRQNLALAITSTDDSRFGRRCDPAAVLDKRSDGEALDHLLVLFLQGDVPAASRVKLTSYLKTSKSLNAPPFWSADDVQNHRLRSLTHLVLSLPEYQLS